MGAREARQVMQLMPKLTLFLQNNGYIYTVRKYDMVRKIVEIEKVGTCLRIPCGKVTQQIELEPFVYNSGFSSSEEWWNMILRFTKDSPKYLYRVEMI